MFKNIAVDTGYIFSTIKSSFLPALLLLCALAFFYAENPTAENVPLILHCCFWATTAVAAVLICLADQTKPLFSLLLGLTAYIIINQLRHETGVDFCTQPEFQALCLVLPLDLVMLHYLPQKKLLRSENLYLLLFLLAQAVAVPLLFPLLSHIPHLSVTLEYMPLPTVALWLASLFIILLGICTHKSILLTGTFYADCALFMALIYAGDLFGLTIFFLIFSVILCLFTVLDLYHRYFYDSLDDVYSKNAYFNHAHHRFPFKYTIAIFSLDNRDKLLQILGAKHLQTLEQMVIDRIKNMPYDMSFYRYTAEEIILVFKNEDAKHVKEFADNIRRTVAVSEFILANHKSLKITISLCVSEKTRKDLNATEITERAHNALQKNYRFNCNIVTVA